MLTLKMERVNIMELDREMMELFMHSAPGNIFFKDTECKYCFASEICNLVNCGKNGTIIGKTDLEIQNNKELGRFDIEMEETLPDYLQYDFGLTRMN